MVINLQVIPEQILSLSDLSTIERSCFYECVQVPIFSKNKDCMSCLFEMVTPRSDRFNIASNSAS